MYVQRPNSNTGVSQPSPSVIQSPSVIKSGTIGQQGLEIVAVASAEVLGANPEHMSDPCRHARSVLTTKSTEFFKKSYNLENTGSSRKNEKSKSCSKGVYFYKILILTPFSGRKIATNNSPTPSRSLRNVLRLPSKVAPPTLAEWKSGTGSPKRASRQPQTGL